MDKVFGIYDIGDIVVSLVKKGIYRNPNDMFQILGTSTKKQLWFLENTHSTDPETWRKATEEEVKAYESGVRNIKDIPKTMSKEELLEEAKRRYPAGTRFNCAKTEVKWVEGFTGCEINKNTQLRISSDGKVIDAHGVYFVYWEGKWAEIVSQEPQYYPDLSQHIGRYLKALVNEPNGGIVQKGEYGKIVNHYTARFPSDENYFCSKALSEGYLGVKYELMPEGWMPEQENEKYEVGKWYKSTPEDNNRGGAIYYGKYSGGDFKVSSYRVSGSIVKDNYTFSSGYIWEELTDLAEIQNLLPEGHPDKFKYVGKAVHCTTQEEWNFVLSKFNPRELLSSQWKEYEKESCICILDEEDVTNKGCYCNLQFYTDNNYQILSFKEWCEMNDYSFEKELIQLPEKWYVKFGTKENFQVLKKYFEKFNNNYTKYTYTGSHRCWDYKNNYYSDSYLIEEKFTEITFEQFKKWVLKESEEFKVGDWIVVTQSGGGTHPNDVGLVCKIVSTNAKSRFFPQYTIEIDRNKIGNNDRFLKPDCIRKAYPHEIPSKNPKDLVDVITNGVWESKLEYIDFEVKSKPTNSNKIIIPKYEPKEKVKFEIPQLNYQQQSIKIPEFIPTKKVREQITLNIQQLKITL